MIGFLIQISLVLIQCLIAYASYADVKKRDKAMFKIAYRNVCIEYFDKDTNNGPMWQYDINRLIPFRNAGYEFVGIISTKTYVDGNLTRKSDVDNIINFGDEFRDLYLDLNCSDSDKEKEVLNVKIVLTIKNYSGYIYKQNIYIIFKRKNTIWNLHSYNWDYKDIGIHERANKLCHVFRKRIRTM